jgi:hypothetical protein
LHRVAEERVSIIFIRRELQVAFPVYAGLNDIGRNFSRVFGGLPRSDRPMKKKTNSIRHGAWGMGAWRMSRSGMGHVA